MSSTWTTWCTSLTVQNLLWQAQLSNLSNLRELSTVCTRTHQLDNWSMTNSDMKRLKMRWKLLKSSRRSMPQAVSLLKNMCQFTNDFIKCLNAKGRRSNCFLKRWPKIKWRRTQMRSTHHCIHRSMQSQNNWQKSAFWDSMSRSSYGCSLKTIR